MSAVTIFLAVVRFACWETALFAAAMRLARLIGWREDQPTEERWLAVLAIQVTLESSFAALFSFTRMNSATAYWITAAVCAACALALPGWNKHNVPAQGRQIAGPIIAALVLPLVLLSFKPVEEIDSINYLHYLIEWMANRATPYTFATNYVAFWELSFLPSWTVTGVDLFFPILALKAVLMMGLGLWLVGRELGLPQRLLLWTVFGSVTMRHFWYEYSGVPTLKNDALHGVGFVLMALVVLRAAQRKLAPSDVALLAFGAAFGAVKYTGIFVAVIAIGVVWFLRRAGPRPTARTLVGFPLFFLVTSGHYYVSNLIRYGSPFYPFQINIAFVHLPGTADLSATSILYSLHDVRLWRALFLPEGGVSPAGLLFPAILAGTLLAATWRILSAALAWLRRRAAPSPRDWAAFLLLCGWLLYFRSVFSASGYAGDLSFILNGLNSIRYVDGVLAASELFLVAVLVRFEWLAAGLVAINLASRLAILYGKEQVFPALVVCGLAAAVLVLFLALGRRAIAAAVVLLVVMGPLLVQRNRERWTTYWNDLKPALDSIRGQDLDELALPDGGYFAGHVVAAGNPVDSRVRSLLPEEIDGISAAARPRYLVILLTPGSEAVGNWETRYEPTIRNWGYETRNRGKAGALFERATVMR